MEEAGEGLGHRRAVKGTGGCLELLICALLMTVSSSGHCVDREASFGGRVVMVSPGEGETTPDQSAIFVDTSV
jgi:hypothetical protein